MSSQVEGLVSSWIYSSRARDKYLGTDLEMKLWALGVYKGEEDR